MKKSLIALAALAATGAFAQSSVTLYGVGDISVAKVPGKQIAASANGTFNNGDSRLGVKGSEDLGGGLKANFNFEQGINLADGSTNANTWQRNAFVELAGGFGSLRAGRSLSPQFYALANFELTGTANYSAVANKFGFAGEPAPRNNANIAYTTPDLGGFKATLGTVLVGNNSGNAKIEVAATYNNGPIAASASYVKTQNVADRATMLGGSYNFGPAKVAVGYYDPATAVKGFSAGVTVPLGAFAVTFDAARDTGSATKSTDTVLELLYNVSKRTFVYGVAYHAANVTAAGFTGTGAGLGLRHNF